MSTAINPQVSVIVPAYSRFSTLRHTVESILSQTIPVLEVIVVDDGSLDETPTMVPRLIEEDPRWNARVRYIHQKNQGQCVALNNGLSQARGTWLGFCGHDDMWLPWKLEWQFRALDQFTSAGLCFTDAWFMNNPHMKMNLFDFYGRRFEGTIGIIPEPTKLIASNRHPLWTQTCIARADLAQQIGGFDPKLRYSEDHDFLFRMGLVTKFCYVNMPMALIDRSPADIRHTGEALNWHKEEFCLRADQYRFEKQLQMSAGLDSEAKAFIRQNLRAVHSSWANWYFGHGDYKKAREALSTAAGYELTPNIAFKWCLSRLSTKLTKKLLAIRDHNAPKPRYDRVSWQESENS